jgi:hypothetical protein
MLVRRSMGSIATKIRIWGVIWFMSAFLDRLCPDYDPGPSI